MSQTWIKKYGTMKISKQGEAPVMKIAILLSFLSFSLINTFTYAASETDNVISQMNEMIAQGQYAQAYTLGQASLFDLEGDPEFDFLYGLAALESGRPDEAVFAFERIHLS